MIAEFSVWKPLGMVVPDAILVLTPPSQSDGRSDVHDPEWQAFAIKHHLALVGCFFQDAVLSGIEKYADAGDSGYELVSFLDRSFNFKVPPILLWGFSAGGQFNYEFAVMYPSWVAGFVVNKGGVYYTALAPKETRDIPALWFIGERDAEWRRDIVRGIVNLNRVAGCQWELVKELDTAHSIGVSKELSKTFFATILKNLKK